MIYVIQYTELFDDDERVMEVCAPDHFKSPLGKITSTAVLKKPSISSYITIMAAAYLGSAVKDHSSFESDRAHT